MIIRKIWSVFFSPTGGTKKYANHTAARLSEILGAEMDELDLTLGANRRKVHTYGEKELVVMAVPVYAGRIPNKIAPELVKCLSGKKTPVILMSVFGNRSYGGALTELQQLLEQNDFIPIARAAVVARHAFSRKIAGDRPDREDILLLEQWCEGVGEKIKQGDRAVSVRLPSALRTQLPPYYMPLDEGGEPARFLKAVPMTDTGKCNGCGVCVRVCPMESIDFSDPGVISGICIKCQSCICHCPVEAKYFTDPAFLSHVRMLEKTCLYRADSKFEI